MPNNSLGLGIDLGTSGVRIAVLNQNREIIYTSAKTYQNGIKEILDWVNCCKELIGKLPISLKERLGALSIDGTSGTLLACDITGNPLGEPLPYYINCPEQKKAINKLISKDCPAQSTSSSLARALRLVDIYGEKILLRHQADWMNSWLTNKWEWGEEGSNIRLGWDLKTQSWPETFHDLPWFPCLPSIIKSGTIISPITPQRAEELGLPLKALVVSGTTDANAAVLTAEAEIEDGITILGSTIVIKRFVQSPIESSGVTNHRIGDQWICGGASNAGGAVLNQFFSNTEIEILSRQIDPQTESGLSLRPLQSVGERFPKDDSSLKPILEPRPVSDSLYLHGLLEGLANIEAEGWKRFIELGLHPPKKIITLGGGACNPQWRKIRENIIGIPIRTCKRPPAAGVALIALKVVTSSSF